MHADFIFSLSTGATSCLHYSLRPLLHVLLGLQTWSPIRSFEQQQKRLEVIAFFVTFLTSHVTFQNRTQLHLLPSSSPVFHPIWPSSYLTFFLFLLTVPNGRIYLQYHPSHPISTSYAFESLHFQYGLSHNNTEHSALGHILFVVNGLPPQHTASYLSLQCKYFTLEMIISGLIRPFRPCTILSSSLLIFNISFPPSYRAIFFPLSCDGQ